MDFADTLIEEFASPGKLVGHMSYVLLILSMMMRSMTWLRIIAVMAGLVSVGYGIVLQDAVVIFWEVIFVSVNLVQLLLMEIQNRRARFSADEEQFINSVLAGVEKAHCSSLLKLAQHVEFDVEEKLTREGEPVESLLFILEGAVRIERDGELVGVCGHDDFLGELGFMLGTEASATAIVANSARCLSFEFEPLKALLDKNHNLRYALEASFNRNVMGKLVKANDSKQPEPELAIHAAE